MRALLKAGACALAMVAGASQADAATFVRYTLVGLGTGERSFPPPPSQPGPIYYYDGPGIFSMTFDLNLSVFPGAAVCGAQLTLPLCGVTYSGNNFRLYESYFTHDVSWNVDATVCLTGPAGIPTAAGLLSFDPSCTVGARLRQADRLGNVSDVTVTRLDQVIVSFLDGSPFDPGFGSGLGGATVAFVPEPATWGMMIAGFGVAGLALRRRRFVRATASPA